MPKPYRSWEERRQIISAIVAEYAPHPVSHFSLTTSEEVYFRARTRRAVDRLARQSATFKTYYRLRHEQPFLYVLGLAGVIVTFGVAASFYLYLRSQDNDHLYPLLGASATVVVAAIGWCVGAWIAHRNAVRQNTNNLLFARFSQTAFTESMHHFHATFGNDLSIKVSPDRIAAARRAGDIESKGCDAVNYLLNYFEFIAGGVLRGDLDPTIVRENIRGVICFYYDKCEPHILATNRRNGRAFEHLMKLRTHYREP